MLLNILKCTGQCLLLSPTSHPHPHCQQRILQPQMAIAPRVRNMRYMCEFGGQQIWGSDPDLFWDPLFCLCASVFSFVKWG